MSDQHWHVLGSGAMGCLFASTMHQGGLPTTLVVRKRGSAKRLTVRVEREGGEVQLELPASESADPEPIHKLLVTTKAQDVQDAVQSLSHRLGKHSQVLLLANGMGYAEQLLATLPAPTYYFGTTTAGAYRVAPLHIRPAGTGLTCIGIAATKPGAEPIGHLPVNEPPVWFKAFAAANQPCRWDPDIRRALWLKLAINCAINPLTALNRCSNGDLAREPHLRATVAKLCDEIAVISAAAGYSETTAELHREVAGVIAATAENRSSMLQDVLAGRPTEIDYITGYLLRVANTYGVAAPENTALYESILTYAD